MAAAPSAAPRRGRGGGGAVIALIVIVLLLGAGGVVFAFMHGSNPNPLSPIASGDAAQPTVAAGGAVDAAQADAGAAVADNTSNKDKTPGLIDTSLPPLPTGPIPPPSNSDHAAAHKPDASAPSTPTAPPAPSHSAAPAPTPSSSTTDPAECKKARQLQKTMERPGANPSQKDFAAFANLRKKCVAEGGHL
jgi:hypothetical protein